MCLTIKLMWKPYTQLKQSLPSWYRNSAGLRMFSLSEKNKRYHCLGMSSNYVSLRHCLYRWCMTTVSSLPEKRARGHQETNTEHTTQTDITWQVRTHLVGLSQYICTENGTIVWRFQQQQKFLCMLQRCSYKWLCQVDIACVPVYIEYVPVCVKYVQVYTKCIQVYIECVHVYIKCVYVYI